MALLLQQAAVQEDEMRNIDVIPWDPNANTIASIINLVCPQCGGSMLEFQCHGKCGRNWIAEWEWANLTTRSLDFNRPTRPERRTR